MKKIRVLLIAIAIGFVAKPNNSSAQLYYQYSSNEPYSKWTKDPINIINIDRENNKWWILRVINRKIVASWKISDYGTRVRNKDGSYSYILTIKNPYGDTKTKLTEYSDYIIQEDGSPDETFYSRYKLVEIK